MAGDRATVRVTIFNQPYTLAASGNPQEVEALAQEVDELMTQIAQRAGNVDATRAAVLASLHLADRLRTIENELREIKARVDAKSQQFAMLLDGVIE
jgi:cell division protein ZapA